VEETAARERRCGERAQRQVRRAVAQSRPDGGRHMTRSRTTLPPGLACYKRTPLFTPENVPEALLSAHRIKAGVWGLLRVEQGRVRYCLEAEPGSTLEVAKGGTAVIEPEALHHVELLDADSAFFVEFYRSEARA